MDKVLYFAASIFWRGAVHDWPSIDGGKIELKLRLFKYTRSSTGRILRIRGGTGDLKNWMARYDAAMRVLSSLSGKKNCYYFKPHPDLLDPNGCSSIEGVIRYGGTIVGNAIQLAYNFGVTEILLCGADMSGDGYWDGTVNRERVHGNVWIAVSYLNPLLSWLMNQKHIRISTLSQTRLDVPAYRPSDRKAR